jgi:hypothetical protein
LNANIPNGNLLAGIAAPGQFQGDDAKKILCGKPIAHSQVVFFYKKSKFPKGLKIKPLTKLQDYKIATERGAPMVGMLQSFKLKLDLGNDTDTIFKKLEVDRVDLATTVDAIGLQSLSPIAFHELKRRF